MEEKEYESIEQMRGSMSYMNVDDPAKFERANYMKFLTLINKSCFVFLDYCLSH